MRAAWRRTWWKMYPIDCLEGSIRYQLEPDERGVWYDLLNLVAISAIDGVICDKDKRAYPHSFIANRLNLPLELLERTLKKCIKEGRLKENAVGITIVNWKIYQSEYQRQKPYRQAKKIKKRWQCDCGYALEYSSLTKNLRYCPQKKCGKEMKIVDVKEEE